ncbi:TPA: ead/Ea22-like family protein [Serratia marcescens]
MDKFSELKAAAMAATPGPWSWKLDGIFYYLSPEGVNNPLFRIIDDGSAWGEYAETIEHDGPDARFIAAANPAVVLALLAELEAKTLEGRCIEQERELFRVERTAHQQHAQELEKRIAELEAIKADASQVFKEIGNELGCNPDNESIMMAIDKLKERLATPVRLPTKYSMLHREDFHSDYQSKMVFKADEVISALHAHGLTVEGDE